MRTDISKYIKDQWPNETDRFLDRIRQWDLETKGLLGDRLLRSVLLLSSNYGDFEDWIAISRTDWQRVYRLAENDESGIRILDLSKPFDSGR